MKALVVLFAMAAVLVVAIGAGSGLVDPGNVLITLVLAVFVLPLVGRLGTKSDPWIWWVAPLGFVAKLVGAGIRYWVLINTYEGVGDAVRYHRQGQEYAEVWQALIVPSSGGGSGAGTHFVDVFTGLIYALYQPTLLGGFFIFATLAFFGQVLFYLAFRRSVPEGHLGVYAAFVFFLPGLVFWPSSVGKESLMIFSLGLATYGLTRAFDGYRVAWLILGAVGLAGAGVIRPHMAAILAGAYAAGALMGRGHWNRWAGIRRVLVIVAATALVGVSVASLGERYELESADDLDPFVADIQRRTQQGGSSVTGGAVASPADLPGAFVRVLFRPLPNEAHNLQAMASAIENLALLGVIIWRLPWMLGRLNRLRTPYVLMSAAFTTLFVVAFSAIFNLGILARQRSQVLPYLLVVVVALGWDARKNGHLGQAEDEQAIVPAQRFRASDAIATNRLQ